MVFGKSEGLSGIADDTFVYGIGEIQHDQRILNVLDTKMKSDENKIKAIRNMPPPTNLAELQSLHRHDQLHERILAHHSPDFRTCKTADCFNKQQRRATRTK